MEIKRTIIVITMLLTALSGSYAQETEPYFCVREGAVLEYERKFTDGQVKWYHTMEIVGVESLSESASVVEYTSHILNHKRRPYYGDEPARLSARIDGGDVVLNVAESVASVFRTLLPQKTKISSTGGESALPSDMAPGDTLPDVYASVKALGMTMKITVTQRRVLRYETIATEAGTFDCIVVRERKVEKGMGRNRHTVADTWYAKGVGMVRHDTHDKDMELQTSEILKNIK